MAVYATITDLANLGLPESTLRGATPAVKDGALSAASRTADGYLQKRFTLPLASWSDDLTQAVVSIAAWYILSRIGFNPAMGADQAIAKRSDDAIAWLRDVSRGVVEPVLVDATPSTDEQAPIVMSDDALSWAWPSSGNGCDS